MDFKLAIGGEGWPFVLETHRVVRSAEELFLRPVVFKTQNSRVGGSATQLGHAELVVQQRSFKATLPGVHLPVVNTGIRLGV